MTNLSFDSERVRNINRSDIESEGQILGHSYPDSVQSLDPNTRNKLQNHAEKYTHSVNVTDLTEGNFVDLEFDDGSIYSGRVSQIHLGDLQTSSAGENMNREFVLTIEPLDLDKPVLLIVGVFETDLELSTYQTVFSKQNWNTPTIENLSEVVEWRSENVDKYSTHTDSHTHFEKQGFKQEQMKLQTISVIFDKIISLAFESQQ